MALPPEIREQIWIHTVIEWKSKRIDVNGTEVQILERQIIHIDRFNSIWPPAITEVNKQLRRETLHLYYAYNVFSCWRPQSWDVVNGTLYRWLRAIGPEMRGCLIEVQLMYKQTYELDDEDTSLEYLGLMLRDGVVCQMKVIGQNLCKLC